MLPLREVHEPLLAVRRGVGARVGKARALPARRRPQRVEVRRRLVVQDPMPKRLALHQHLGLLLRADRLRLARLRLREHKLCEAECCDGQVLQLLVDGVLELRELVGVYPVRLQLVQLHEVSLVGLHPEALVELIHDGGEVQGLYPVHPLSLSLDVRLNPLLHAVELIVCPLELLRCQLLWHALLHAAVHHDDVVLRGLVEEDLVHPLDRVVLRPQPLVEGLDRIHAELQLRDAVLLEGAGLGLQGVGLQAHLRVPQVLCHCPVVEVGVELRVDGRQAVREAPELVVRGRVDALEAQRLVADQRLQERNLLRRGL
mmetsp:Transcript_33073/g.87435  ORF Transcript_33073/g.87435 Transcript_33073/m.87435 type:complete len:315 (+) Transcript_33073:95-1039(+)